MNNHHVFIKKHLRSRCFFQELLTAEIPSGWINDRLNSHLAVLDPEKKTLNFIFPTKYGIPKSSKPVSHWLSKESFSAAEFDSISTYSPKVFHSEWKPLKAMVVFKTSRVFLLGPSTVTFQGRIVKLREGIVENYCSVQLIDDSTMQPSEIRVLIKLLIIVLP